MELVTLFPTRETSRVLVFRNWVAGTKKKIKYGITLFTISHTQRHYMGTKFVAARQKLEQIQLAWFNHHRTFHIKLLTFDSTKARRMQRRWFNIKRRLNTQWSRSVRKMSIDVIFGHKHPRVDGITT